MKHSTNKTLPRRKLALHREAIALLTAAELTKAIGGFSPSSFPCSPPQGEQDI
jgi:hypothetical protein